MSAVLSANPDSFRKAATILSVIYILGFVAVMFLPETRGKPLSDSV